MRTAAAGMCPSFSASRIIRGSPETPKLRSLPRVCWRSSSAQVSPRARDSARFSGSGPGREAAVVRAEAAERVLQARHHGLGGEIAPVVLGAERLADRLPRGTQPEIHRHRQQADRTERDAELGGDGDGVALPAEDAAEFALAEAV